jgi:ribonuclease E
VQAEARKGQGARLLYSDQDLILKALRDHLDGSVDEVLVDDDGAHEQALEYMQAYMPRSKTRLERYAERLPLFSKFGLESQIERIFHRTVPLPSGGSIVVDSTEALTAIDVNSGRASNGGSHEEMAISTNLEAAREVGRQLRLRDLGGLVVVDFIDMRSSKGKRTVEKGMKEAMKSDKARSTVGRISPNGLLEINRQKIQQALRVRAHRPCPTCSGTGRVPSIESVGLNLLRRIEARAATGRLMKARIELHSELAEAIQNGRRKDFARLEEEFGIEIEIVASHRLLGPEEQIEWRDRPSALSVTPLRPLEPVARREAAARRAAPAAVTFPAAEPEAAEPEPAEAESAANGNGKKKRRRRGGRRRKGKGEGAATPASGELILFASPATDAGEVDEADEPNGNVALPNESAASGGNGSAAPRGKRRRRGGRRRGGKRRGASTGGAEAIPSPAETASES